MERGLIGGKYCFRGLLRIYIEDRFQKFAAEILVCPFLSVPRLRKGVHEIRLPEEGIWEVLHSESILRSFAWRDPTPKKTSPKNLPRGDDDERRP